MRGITGTHGVYAVEDAKAMLQQKGWSSSVIVPLVYQALLHGRLDPKGNTAPYRAN